MGIPFPDILVQNFRFLPRKNVTDTVSKNEIPARPLNHPICFPATLPESQWTHRCPYLDLGESTTHSDHPLPPMWHRPPCHVQSLTRNSPCSPQPSPLVAFRDVSCVSADSNISQHLPLRVKSTISSPFCRLHVTCVTKKLSHHEVFAFGRTQGKAAIQGNVLADVAAGERVQTRLHTTRRWTAVLIPPYILDRS